MERDNIAFLLADCAQLARRRFDERARHVGLTGAQARLILLVNRFAGEQQAFYAGWLDVEPITICRRFDRLEEAGFVERRPDPADRRVRRIFATADGEAMAATLRPDIDRLVGQVSEGFEKDEHEMLTAMLRRIRSNLSSPEQAAEVARG